MRILLKTSLALLLIAAATEVYGTTLYKLTSPSGEITYTDAVPKGFRGTVKRLDIDTSERVAVLTPGAQGQVQATAPDYAEIIRRRGPADDEARVAQARERLEAARQALAAAQERSTPDDWIYVGPGNPLGMKRVPRPEYQARLENLERNLQIAEDQLRRAERG
ncbi:MAG TPA: hypothetical protein VFK48_05205 [Usitatibacter sp.]|nr:hypothetical protein [Usitatibacter sp.]